MNQEFVGSAINYSGTELQTFHIRGIFTRIGISEKKLGKKYLKTKVKSMKDLKN